MAHNHDADTHDKLENVRWLGDFVPLRRPKYYI